MVKLHFVIPAIIAMLILIIYLTTYDISGVWVAPDDFCQSAEIESMTVIFTRNFTGYTGIIHMPGYIGEFSLGARFSRSGKTTAKVAFAESPIFPDSIKIEYDIPAGRLVLHDEETTYAVLFKDNELTYIADAQRSALR